MSRRQFLIGASAFAGVGLFAPGSIPAYASPQGDPAAPGPGPYGPATFESGVADLVVPGGFEARVIATSGATVANTAYRWHDVPDGGAVFPNLDGGWIYTSNSEGRGGPTGGCSSIRFTADGVIADAFSILEGTEANSSGGPTPWTSWLSCEAHDIGMVWECDPTIPGNGVARPGLGVFRHKAAAVDLETSTVYLTEDQPDGLLYRFVPTAPENLDDGVLEAARVDDAGQVTWQPIPDPAATNTATRQQLDDVTPFNRAAGCWYDDGWLYFATKGDDRLWAIDLANQQLVPVYRASDHEGPSPLFGVDSIVVSRSGDLFVAEAGGDLRISIIAADTLDVVPILQLSGPRHTDSEIAGPAFSADGHRLYFSSQHADGTGETYEVSGPFRQERIGALGASALDGRAATPRPTVPAPTSTTIAVAPQPESGGSGGLPIVPIAGVTLVGAALAFALRRRAAAIDNGDSGGNELLKQLDDP